MGYIVNFDNSNNIRAAFLNDAMPPTPPTPPTPEYELTELEAQLRDDAISRLNAVNPNHRYMAFGFITDLHESYDGIGYGTGTNPPLTTSKPSLKLLSAIAESYGLDGVLFGGDYSLGGDLSYAQYDAALEELLSTVTSSITVPHFAVEGNHDRWYDKNTNCRGNTVWKRFLTRFNTPNMAVFPTKNDATNGYVANSYYVDFPKYKVRVVMRSQYETQEKNGVPCSNSAGNGLGHFVNNLDDCMTFSNPSTASQWTVLCISHRALSSQNHWNGSSSLNKFFNGTLNGGTKGKAIVGEIYGHVHSTSSSKNEMNSDGTLLRVAQTNAFTTDLESPTNTSGKSEYVNNDYRFSLYIIDTASFELHEIKVGIQYNITDNQYYNSSTRTFSYPFKHNTVEPSGDIFKFYHISDTHTCVNAIDECRSLSDADGDVKFTILTGDYGPNSGSFSTTGATANALRSFNNSGLLALNGNHEMWNGFSYYPNSTSSKTATNFLKEIVDSGVKFGDASGVSSYWHADYPLSGGKKLRVISVDSYEFGYVNYKDFSRFDTAYHQSQVDWFIDRIKELSPEDFLLVALHEPPVNSTGSPDASCVAKRRKNNFCSARLTTWDSSYSNGNLWPIVIDAYMNRQRINATVQNMNTDSGTSSSSVSINDDFSSVYPCTFLGYLCGHMHNDMCHYHPEFDRQLIMAVDWANTAQGPSDIATRPNGVLINEVTLDFNNRKIIINRIGNKNAGSYNSFHAIVRDAIEFPFIDS